MVRQDIDIGLVEGPIEDRNLIAKPWRTDVMKLLPLTTMHLRQRVNR
jgi:hypothetical protein